jgi:hypothetical protein
MSRRKSGKSPEQLSEEADSLMAQAQHMLEQLATSVNDDGSAEREEKEEQGLQAKLEAAVSSAAEKQRLLEELLGEDAESIWLREAINVAQEADRLVAELGLQFAKARRATIAAQLRVLRQRHAREMSQIQIRLRAAALLEKGARLRLSSERLTEEL